MNKVPLIKPTLMGKKTIFKTDTIPTKGSNNIVTSDALAQALQDKVVNKEEEGEKTIVPTGDIIIGRLLEDGFYISDPTFLGTKLIKVETPEPGKFYYDRTTHTYYTFQGYNETGYNFKPVVLPNLTELTWQELKDLRDDSKLIPGSFYRITDYQCTTTQKNTKSAGHQFDIVLLALSENKLAEEGWAMEHPSDVYDVTFRDGVTIKCYLCENSDGNVNIVRISDLLGFDSGEAFEDWEQSSSIDYNNKTLIYNTETSSGVNWITNVPYNYFQNSNLSAWKVWYCLDNDKSRFAWADDGETESINIYGDVYSRNSQGDADGYYAWEKEGISNYYFTKSPTPKVGDITYLSDGNGNYEEDDPITAVSGFGHGVIYRLIDEWNNDVPYDFKNIMLSVGTGKDSYGYLFSRSNYIGDKDYSINGAFVNVSIAQYPTYTGDIGGFINSIESGILAPSLRTGERLQDIKIASGYLTSNGQIDQLSSHSIIGYSTEFSKT